MDRLEQLFAEEFSHWEIYLPEGASTNNETGSVSHRGWFIRYLFGTDPGRGRYVDHYAQHRMTNDRHIRLWESGETEWLPAADDFMVFPEGSSAAEKSEIEVEFDTKNQAINEEIDLKFAYNRAQQESVDPDSTATTRKEEQEVNGNDGAVAEYVARVLAKHAPAMLAGDGVAVPFDDEEMNWRLFFAHSQDMQGFRADIFTGGPNEEDNPFHPSYRGLRDRWTDSKTMIAGLAGLWQSPQTQDRLVALTGRSRSSDDDGTTAPMLAILRGPDGNDATRTFAEALEELSGPRIAFKTRLMIRAYVQNSALLAKHGCSFQTYLLSLVPNLSLPQADIVTAERAWRKAIARDFFNVGPALANYLIADWLLSLWRDGQLGWFESYKSDSVFLKTLAESGKLPPEAGIDFPAYCRTIPRLDFMAGWTWPDKFPFAVPPRLLNEGLSSKLCFCTIVDQCVP
jgi:hypothetical protein